MLSKPLWSSLVFAAALIFTALAVKYLERLHLLTPDAADRGMQIVIGLTLAAYSNFIPKRLPASPRSEAALERAMSTLRLSGWIFTLAGLGYAAVWVLAPSDLAFPLSLAGLGGATLFCLGYCLWTCNRSAPRAIS